MASLRRIILVNTHLTGVVELALDAHTNICGTNASGKTTLQRLIPVFYGELPSKVVPKTRSKFGSFYLPKSNSYLSYEYQREDGELCQVVLTHTAKDGISYRFVDAAYDKEQLLFQEGNGKVTAHEPDQWLAKLTTLGIKSSRKISSTSEFRAIIQNDVSAIRGNTQEGTKLRQLAARYSLVSPQHKIRHLEKLVSAVHAKEGKMDTLKTMLAAIFEEDGLVQPTTRVKNTKAREWIKQIRQSMRLTSLETQHQEIEQVASSLNTIEAQLLQLTPLLTQDLEHTTTKRADLQSTEKHLKQQVTDLKNSFNDQETTINSQLSKCTSDLTVTEQQLDSLQQTYDAYQDGDIEQLAIDSDTLPLWIEELSEQQSHYRILLEQYGDLEQQLNQQKLTLNESLERLTIKNRKQSRQVEEQREQTREQQSDKKDQLSEQYLARKEQLTEDFDAQITKFSHQKIQRQAQIDNMGATAQEQEDLTLSNKRLELSQENWRKISDELAKKSHEHQQARQTRQQTQHSLEQARTHVHQLQNKLRELIKQISPEQGSLRHYLRTNIDGWENSIGKVINQDLLERVDLQPNIEQLLQTEGSDSISHTTQGSIYGVSVKLSDIQAPSYAQDEAALRLKQTELERKVEAASITQSESETALTKAHEQVKALSEAVASLKQQLSDKANEVDFAKESKQRLILAHKQSLILRREAASDELHEAINQLATLNDQKRESLKNLKNDHQSQLLEFKADWQQEIDILNQKISELESQIDEKRQSNRVQIKQLEDAFKLELANKDIDPKTLESLKSRIKKLESDISRVRSRQDELREYRHFMDVSWQKLRPNYLEKEATLKADIERFTAELNKYKTQYKQKLRQFEQEKSILQSTLASLLKLIEQLTPLTHKLAQLEIDVELAKELTPIEGDQDERIARASQGLEHRSKTQSQLKEKLNTFESQLIIDAQKQFIDLMTSELSRLGTDATLRQRLPVFKDLLQILADQQRQILEQGETIGGDLHKFFTVFSDINRRIAGQSKRLTAAVGDDLMLDGINRSEVKIISTVDELHFWQPLKRFSQLYEQWRDTGKELPTDDYIDALSDVVDLLRADSSYSIESLLRLELHLNEGGSDLVIKNDRQLLESSSHGMAYLILCKFLLAFTRLLRGDAKITVNWPIDEIGTLAYHNVEKLFTACDNNNINIVGAFPNPESDVLTLFKHRYLIDKQYKRLQRIEPKVNRIEEKLAQKLQQATSQGVN